MTIRLYESDMQAAACEATVVAVTDDNQVVLDQTVFYAQGGGQPGDIGTLAWQGGQAEVTNTTKGEEGAILHQLAEGAMKPVVGARVRASLDWDRRHRLMRMHTGLHLLCTVVGAPVTGGSIGADKGRLDFDLAESPDREAIQAGLDAAIAADYPVSLGQISDADLDANPGLVRTMSVQPPRNGGVIAWCALDTKTQMPLITNHAGDPRALNGRGWFSHAWENREKGQTEPSYQCALVPVGSGHTPASIAPMG